MQLAFRTVRKHPLFIAGSVVLALVSARRAFVHLFSCFRQYDDTGFMLSLIQGFNERGSLYRETFSQYGPFYSEFYLFVGRVLHVPITHDGIRWVTLVLWVGSSIAGGAVAYRVARSIWIGLFIQGLSFSMLYLLINEPGHPVSLAVALLAGMVVTTVLTGEGNRARGRAVVTGLLAGVLCMTKINLGLFALAALGTACAFCSPSDLTGRVLRWTTGFLFCLGGLILVKPAGQLETRWAFLTLFLCALVAVLVVAPTEHLPWSALRRFGAWAFGALCLAVALSVSGVVLSGTAWSDLIRGVIVQPMALRRAFNIPPPDMSYQVATIAVISLAAASAWRLFVANSVLFSRWIPLGLRVAFVVLVTGWITGSCSAWPVFAFLWIAILPNPTLNEGENRGHFGQIFLVLLAVGELLGIYPISGAQMAVPFYLAALCLFPVLRGLLDFAPLQTPRRRSLLVSVCIVVIVATPGVVLAKLWRDDVKPVAKEYRRRTSLGLPGANLVRLSRPEAATYKCLAANLRRCRPTFLSLPGLNSLYGWAQRSFPTGFNTTMNFALLTPEEQQVMVAIGRTCKPIALVRHGSLVDSWVSGRFQPSGPLVDFARGECRVVGRVQGYELMSLKSEPAPRLVYCALLTNSALPNGPSQIRITLPTQSSKIVKASLVELSPRSSHPPATPLMELSQTKAPHDSGGTEEFQSLVFQNPDGAGLTPASLDRFLVQLRGESGEIIAEVPFAQLAAELPQ